MEAPFDARRRLLLDEFVRTHDGDLADAIHVLMVCYDGLCGAAENVRAYHDAGGQAWWDAHDRLYETLDLGHGTGPAPHYDAELNRPEHLTDERLVEIVAECLNRWDAFPTIPGSKRWATNGRTALVELEYRLAMERRRV